MSSRSKQCDHRGTGSHRSGKQARPLAAAVIGGAGIVLSAPVAALFIGSGVAQAAPPLSPPTNQSCVAPVCPSLFGDRASTPPKLAAALSPAALDLTSLAPGFDLGGGFGSFIGMFVGNGTAEHPDAGLFIGNGYQGAD